MYTEKEERKRVLENKEMNLKIYMLIPTKCFESIDTLGGKIFNQTKGDSLNKIMKFLEKAQPI